MFLGKTDNLQESKRIEVKKKIGLVTTVFLITMFLPLMLYAIFYFDVVPSKSAFEGNIQEPVAKIMTADGGSGTAFLISPTLLLTARHVVENYKVGDIVDLYFEQSKTKLQVKGKIKFIAPSNVQSINGEVPMDYFLTDIAVIEVSEITEIEPLIIGDSEAVSNLDEVILIGYPDGDYSITKGNINSNKFKGFNLFKLDATSNPGNSGGPCILKIDNSVIGILVGGSGPLTNGENIATKIDDVKRMLDSAGIAY